MPTVSWKKCCNSSNSMWICLFLSESRYIQIIKLVFISWKWYGMAKKMWNTDTKPVSINTRWFWKNLKSLWNLNQVTYRKKWPRRGLGGSFAKNCGLIDLENWGVKPPSLPLLSSNCHLATCLSEYLRQQYCSHEEYFFCPMYFLYCM